MQEAPSPRYRRRLMLCGMAVAAAAHQAAEDEVAEGAGVLHLDLEGRVACVFIIAVSPRKLTAVSRPVPGRETLRPPRCTTSFNIAARGASDLCTRFYQWTALSGGFWRSFERATLLQRQAADWAAFGRS
jgi:hypothetical protein